MAGKVADPSLVQKRLEAALKRASPKDIVSARPMAEITGMSWVNLRESWIKPDPKFPIKTRGAEGVQWEFQVTKVLRYMIRICKKRIADQKKANERQAKITGVDVPKGENGTDLTALSKMMDMTLKSSSEKQRQGEYVHRSTVAGFIGGYNSMILNGILGVTNQVDPTGSLPAETRKQMDEFLIELATSVKAEAEKFIGEIGANLQQRGNP